MHDMVATRQRTHPSVKFAAHLLAAFGALAVPLAVQAENTPVAETFQHEVCDVAAIFWRLSGTATSGTQHISPTDGPYRIFALDIARRNGFEDPRAIGGAMNGRALFLYFRDPNRRGPYTFAYSWLTITTGSASRTADVSAISSMTSLRCPS